MSSDSRPIYDRLRSVHQGEIDALCSSKAYASSAKGQIKRYLEYILNGWQNIFKATIHGEMNAFDILTYIFFNIISEFALGLLLLWCLFANFPVLEAFYVRWSSLHAAGLSIVNSAYPRLFKSLTDEEVDAAKEALSRPWDKSLSSEFVRVFDLDLAKALLLLAAVMYEPNTIQFRTALQNLNAANKTTNQKAQDDAATGVNKAVQSRADVISAFCATLGIESALVSELNSFSTACASVFWDNDSNWIVVAFRGTTPTEYEEWVDDLKFTQVPAGPWLPDFGKVHGGFKNRIFPDSVDNKEGNQPYQSIASAVQALSQHLLQGKPSGTEINVWFTGHSLGCAMASLAYSRAIIAPEELGPSVRVRDAYLFAAPVVCDVISFQAFNHAIKSTEDRGRTMWRVTNDGDAVATLLPDLGDRKGLKLSSNNVWAFAHLGAELKMEDHPTPCKISGRALHHRTQVKVSSLFSEGQLDLMRQTAKAQGAGLKNWERAALKIPFIGRLVAHGTVYYWDQLSRVGTGECYWITTN